MVVSGDGLDDPVVSAEVAGDGGAEGVEGDTALGTAFNPTAERRAESYVPSVRSQSARLAMIVVTTGHDAPVYVEDELGGDPLVGR